MSAKITLGPVLYIGRCDATTWKMFVNLLIEGGDSISPPIEITSTDCQVGTPVIASNFASEGLDEYVSWRWELTAARQAQEQWLSYTFLNIPLIESFFLEMKPPYVLLPIWLCLKPWLEVPLFRFLFLSGHSNGDEFRILLNSNE